MCGIIGITGSECKEKAEKGLEVMKNRGSDNSHIWSNDVLALGHNLHSVVSFVEQPIIQDNLVFAANCEIYNWEKLSEKYSIDAKNDAELLFELFKKKGTECLDELDGVYAFVYFDGKKITLARDIIGVKPLFYCLNEFAFASEKKSLFRKDVKELNPRSVLQYDTESKEIKVIERKFFDLGDLDLEHSEIVEKLEKKILAAINKRIPEGKFGILFSGGIDSTLIAYVCKKNNLDFTCYTAAIEGIGEAQDLVYAKKIAEELDLDLKVATIKLEELEAYIKKVSPLIESNNVVKIGVALPFFLACELAQKDNIKVIFSGLGSEELFAGYERHAVSAGINKPGYEEQKNAYEKLDIGNVNKECLSGLMQIHERDMYRDDVVTMYNKLELRLPLLDKDLIDFALRIPGKFKINTEEKKIILRDVAEKMGLTKEYARRPKKAAQYGSKFDKGLEKLAKKQGLRKSQYLKQFFEEPNLKLGAMLSTGKDSIYAAMVMDKQNYEISCFLTMNSKNEHSFMFHTPNISLAKKQAEAAEIPIIVQETEGEKEKELDDLEKLFLKAKDTFGIDGIITGALFSTYQRDRIEKVCDKLGLICRNPLWHKNQEDYMYELINNNVEFIFAAVMSEGLDGSWVGRVIEKEDVDNLVALNKKTGMNVAGEGGEFETFVVNCPLFKKKLVIKNSELVVDPEREENIRIDIKEIILN